MYGDKHRASKARALVCGEPQKHKKFITPESESNNKMFVQIISTPNKRVVKKLRKRSSDNSDVITKEQEY
jgi:hypothetical protein